MKEYRVYCNPTSYFEDVDYDPAETILKWQKQDVLSKDAIEFIVLAENEGNVFSLDNFIYNLNNDTYFVDDYYVFVTNKY